MLKKFYKTSEFAKLCRTTKHTLFHYDKIGLLSPSIRKDNGYRYYTGEQFDAFNIINMMKKINIPLNVIKKYLSIKNKELFIEMLVEKQKELSKEIKILENINQMLGENISLLKEDFTSKIKSIQIEECNEEYYIITQCPKVNKVTEKIILNTLSEHFNFCEENFFNIGIHVGEIILKEDIINENFNVSYCYSNIKVKSESTRFYIRPKGTYAIFYYQGNYESLSKIYKSFYSEVKKLGYTISGNLYAEDVIDYFSEGNSEKFIYKISLQITNL